MAAKYGIEALTLFAFSSENWKRPQEEVGLLMELFMVALKQEVKRLRKNNVRLRVIGEKSGFAEKLQNRIREAEQYTAGNSGLVLQIAANYGGRWDITQAVRKIATDVKFSGLEPIEITEAVVSAELSCSDLPDPDLFIRTGGEKRLSNFLLWQSAYAELYFTDILWPDFGTEAFDMALDSYGKRQRRFGLIGEQVKTDG